jgi:hypothetical protein
MSRKRTSKTQGTRWPTASGEPPTIGPVERQTFVVVVALRDELGREPSPDEVGARLGLRDARPRLEAIRALGLLDLELTSGQRKCLIAIAALKQRLGTSPSTKEVSAEMGLSPSASRYHINALAALGLCTRPVMRLVLDVTELGRAFLPKG